MRRRLARAVQLRLVGPLAVLLAVAVVGPPALLAAEEAEPGAVKPGLVGTYDKGFRLSSEDGRFSIRFSGAAQMRYTYLWYDDAIAGNESDYSNLFLRRARLWFDGHAYDTRIRYYFHIQLEPSSRVNLHDAWIQYHISDLLEIGLGRNKIAYGLAFLNSGFGLHFVDRSLMYGETDVDSGGGLAQYPGGGTAVFGLDSADAFTGFPTGGMTLYRSQGIQLQGLRRAAEKRLAFEYQAGVWNGRATRGLANPDGRHLFAARVGLYPRGWIDWLVQGDVANTPHLKLGVLASAYTSRTPRNHNASGREVPRYEAHDRGVNLALESRYRGSSADLEWSRERYDITDATAVGERSFQRQGWCLSLGRFLRPKKLEAVARYAAIQRLRAPSISAARNSGLGLAQVRDASGVVHEAVEKMIRELTLGLSLYLSNDHQHKLSVDVSRLTREFVGLVNGETLAPPPPDQQGSRVRAMVQLKF